MEEVGFARYLVSEINKNLDKKAITFFDNNQNLSEITYKQLLKDVFKRASYFRNNSIANKHIGILFDNCYDWVTLLLGIFFTGNVAVPLCGILPENVLASQIEKSDVDILCVNDNKDYSKIFDSSKIIPASIINGDGNYSFEDIVNIKDNETILLLNTSGTTGESKIAEITSINLLSSVDETRNVMDFESLLLEFPMYHIGGINASLTMLATGKRLDIGRGFKYLYQDLPVTNSECTAVIPALLNSFISILDNYSDQRSKYIGNSLRKITVSGAKVDANLCNKLLNYNLSACVAYGMTETTGSIATCDLNEDIIECSGKIHNGVDIKTVDGEILVNGPEVMKGYYKDPIETDKVLHDGWLSTGDLGYVKDGYIYITGRKKNVIILSNGENVNPEEIEILLNKCNEIIECLVYGDGKGICADIYTKDINSVSIYIKEYNSSVPTYRGISKINYVDKPLEKTAAGKIKRKANIY